MNPREFKAWFEGYTENIEDLPTLKQWKRIQSRVKEIDGSSPTTVHHFHDYYWPNYVARPSIYWQSMPVAISAAQSSAVQAGMLTQNAVLDSSMTTAAVDLSCFTALGKADAAYDLS